jgi:hypothetical protein
MPTTLAPPPNAELTSNEYLAEILEIAHEATPANRSAVYAYAHAFMEMGLLEVVQMGRIQEALGITTEEIDELPI